MKNNLISAIAGWKSAALLALVAMVAAVAFSGVLTSTQTADAQAQTPAVDAIPGQTVVLVFTGTGDRFVISGDSEGTATFVANGGTNLQCTDNNGGCDTDTNTGTYSLAVTVDDDSPFGAVFVQQGNRTQTVGQFTVVQENVITVNRPNPPVAIKAYGTPSDAAISAKPSANETTDISVRIVNARAVGLSGASLLVTTTRGTLTSTNVSGDNTCTGVSACNLTATTAAGADTVDDANDDVVGGTATVTLQGNGSTGTAVVTFRHLASNLTYEASVVLHGDVASVSAEAEQTTIGVGGTTFIVVTILDADGNATVGEQAKAISHDRAVVAVVPPEVPAGTSATPVVPNENGADKIVAPNHPANLPACGDFVPEDDDTTADLDESLAAATFSEGSNTAGKCVIQVTAPNPAGSANDATRGTHTVTIGTDNSRIPTVTVDIQVGGAPASIDTSDAPARVDSLSSTTINVTVLDDEGVRVGEVPITVDQVEGNGQVDDVASGKTSDGRASFTYLAPLSEGEAVFLIRVYEGTGLQIQTTVTVVIGPEAEEAPDAPPATWNDELVSGAQNVVWNGDDDADVADGAAEGVTAIWQWNGTGWDGYFPAAADVPGGNTLATLSNGAAYWVIAD